MSKREFNPIEKKILRVLYQTKVNLTVYEIAKEIGISFPTVKKYVDQLEKDSIILEHIEDGEEKKEK